MTTAGDGVSLPSGEQIGVLGQGTWFFAEDAARHDDEVAALRLGLDLGMTLIDTAEMYADGAAEALVGEAIAGRRDEVFLVDKVLPHHATRKGTMRACRDSLDRLGVEHVDLYLLHWRGGVPLEETIAGFEDLIAAGAIRYWGVSNFDVDDMAELAEAAGGRSVQTNQILYNLTRRGPEFDLLPALRQSGVPVMAYSPIEQGRLLGHRALGEVARRHDATPAQIALAWVLREDGVNAIPRSANPQHVRDNAAARDIRLTAEDRQTLDAAFAPPTRPRPLEML